MEACIKLIKHTVNKCRQNMYGVNSALIQIISQLIGTGILSPAMLLFNRPIWMLLPQIGREPLNINNDYGSNKASKSRHETDIKNNDTHKDSTFFHEIYGSCPEGKWESVDAQSDQRGKQ